MRDHAVSSSSNPLEDEIAIEQVVVELPDRKMRLLIALKRGMTDIFIDARKWKKEKPTPQGLCITPFHWQLIIPVIENMIERNHLAENKENIT